MKRDRGSDEEEPTKTMSWVSSIIGSLCFGPVPVRKYEFDYLRKERDIDVIINMGERPFSEFSTKYAPTRKIALVHLKLPDTVETPEDYLAHAKKILQQPEVDEKQFLYICHKTGFMEELYVAFCLGVLMGKFKGDPLLWLKDKNPQLLDDNYENKEFLVEICKAAEGENRKKNFFQKKK